VTRTTPRVDVRLYVVTDPDLTPRGVVVERALAAVAGGATIVQLRDKAADTVALTGAARALVEALRPTGVPLIVNDDVEAARRAGAAGVHVGVADLPPARARDLLGPDAIIGWSIEDPAQLGDAASVAACDYVAASPVWSTPTKTDTAPDLGLSGVASIRARTTLPVVGIGAIRTPDLAADVITAGADGVAVVSAVFGAADVTGAARALRIAVDEARLMRGER
jgi:thiamine-phosphate pyrophosphorylase